MKIKHPAQHDLNLYLSAWRSSPNPLPKDKIYIFQEDNLLSKCIIQYWSYSCAQADIRQVKRVARDDVCKGLSTPEDAILKSEGKYTVLIWRASRHIYSCAEKFLKVFFPSLWNIHVLEFGSRVCSYKEDKMHADYPKRFFFVLLFFLLLIDTNPFSQKMLITNKTVKH